VRALLGLLLASSFSIPAPDIAPSDARFTSTVGLAGEQIVWIEARGSASALVAATPDGVRRDLLVLAPTGTPGTTRHDLTVAGDVALLQRMACTSVDCRRDRGRESLRVDLRTGAATPFDCSRCFCRAEGAYNLGFQLRGSLLAISRSCREDRVLDLADGTARTVPERLGAAAGRFAVVGGTSDLRVIDWRTGEQIRRVRDLYLDPLSNEIGLGEDGTIAWTDPEGAGVQVLRPADRRPRIVQPASDFITLPRIAGDRLAVRRVELDGSQRIRVSALDGSSARSVDGQSGSFIDPLHDEFGWAFDGARVAWIAQPCALPAIQVWDLNAAPPPPVSEACGATAIPTGRLAFGSGRRTLRVPLSCPAAPVDGCAGDISAHFTARGRAVGDAFAQAFTIPAGTTRTVRLEVVDRRKLRGRLMATVSLRDRARTTDRRFRVQG
jgi:hypothetical protein